MNNIELYQKILMNHYKYPRNQGQLKNPSMSLEKGNSNCGDRIKLEINLDQNKTVNDIKFTGAGCAVCIASSSMMTDAIINKNIYYINSLIKKVKQVLDQKDLKVVFDYQDLTVLRSISLFPPRINCAKLPWIILEELIV